MPAILDPVLAGDTGPTARPKINGNDTRLNAAITANEARLTNLERTAYAAGVTVGLPGFSFSYSALPGAPAALTSRGIAPVASITGGDSDGRATILQMSATRFVAAGNAGGTANGAPAFYAGVIDLAGNGAPSFVSGTVLHTLTGSLNGLAMWGGIASSAVQARFFTSFYELSNAGGSRTYLTTLSIDTNGAASAVVDVNVQPGANPVSTFTNYGQIVTGFGYGTQYRRKGYLVGNNSGIFARPLPSLSVSTLVPWAGIFQVDRNPGSASYFHRAASTHNTAVGYSIDQVSANVFAMLGDNAIQGGGGTSAELSLLYVDDSSTGRLGQVRMGNAVAGNVRLRALSGTLLVGGYTTGSQYNTYAWARDAATNVPTLIGGFSSLGALGQVPMDIFPLTATRFMVLVKGAGWSVIAYVYDVNPAAAAGASPFTLVTSFQFNLGVTVASATSADTVAVYAIEQVGDRYFFLCRNTTRNATFFEVFDAN